MKFNADQLVKEIDLTLDQSLRKSLHSNDEGDKFTLPLINKGINMNSTIRKEEK